MKARALKSPNLADALVYCFANKDIQANRGAPLDYSRMDGKPKPIQYTDGLKAR